MGSNFFTQWADGVTQFIDSDMNQPLLDLDKAITYLKNIIISCDGTITYDKSTGQITWDDTIRITFNRDNGDAVSNTIAAGNITLSDNQFAYVDLNETDGTALTVSAATVTTGAASNFITFNRLVLAYRNATSDDLYPVWLKAIWGAAGLVVNFTDLGDVPASYAGETLKHVRVNVGETALEFVDFAHDIDGAGHNGVSGATEDNLISFDASGLPKDSGLADSDVTDAVSKKHTRLHDIDGTSDHNGVSGATENNLISFNANGLPKDSGVSSTMPFDIGGTYGGTFGASAVVLRIPLTRSVTFPTSLTASQGVLGIAATAQTDFDLLKNAVSFGTMRFAAAGSVATFICAAGASFSAGDVLTVVAPAVPDATAADLGFLLAGTR